MISYPINLLLVYSQNCSLKISDKNNDFPVHLKSNYLCNKTLPFQFHLLFFHTYIAVLLIVFHCEYDGSIPTYFSDFRNLWNLPEK